MFTSTLTNTNSDLLNPTNTIACSFVGLGSPNSVRLGPDANQAFMALQSVSTLTAPTTIAVNCSGFTLQFSGRSDNNVLTVLKVGAAPFRRPGPTGNLERWLRGCRIARRPVPLLHPRSEPDRVVPDAGGRRRGTR